MYWTKFQFSREEAALGVQKQFIDEAQELFKKVPQNALKGFVVNYENDDENGVLINEDEEVIGFEKLTDKWESQIVDRNINLPIKEYRLILLAGEVSYFNELKRIANKKTSKPT